MKMTVGKLKSFIVEAVQLLTEVRCKECNDENEYAEPNQADGSYVCRKCRDLLGIKVASAPKLKPDQDPAFPTHDWRDYKDEIQLKYAQKHYPRAIDAWHINSDKDDMFSIDGEAQLWVEPAWGQPAWRWDEAKDEWIQEEPQ